MRNKKQPTSAPTSEQIALERHVEAMMNPRAEQAAKVAPDATSSTSAPLDIFKGLPAEKVPLGSVKTAPTIPAKTSSKSLFNSVADLRRDQSEEIPVAVAIKPTPPRVTTAPPLGSAMVPKPASLGSTPTTHPSTLSDSAVLVEKLARRDELSDAATDSAVADIVAKEGDDLLAAEDRVRAQQVPPVFSKPKRGAKARAFFTSKWLLLIIPILLIGLAAVPYTRYKLAGLVIKKTLAVTVIDSKTIKPVSGAIISYHGLTTKTNTAGQAMLPVPLGDGKLTIGKGYYQTYNHAYTIGLGGGNVELRVNLVATGRQVPLTILNKLTKQPVTGVTVKILGTSAVTDKAGKVTIALPTRTATASATLSAAGYATMTADVQITDSVVMANTLSIVPAGSLYFLSDASGTMDVIKTNLDGTGRQTVLAGTGHEDATTSLVAARDWRYVVLKSHRDANQSGLYLIDTATDKVTQFDTSAATYTSIGWSGHTFLYDVVRTAQPQSQSGRESLKSYNADQQQLNQLDQTQATGVATSYAYESFNNFFIIGNQLVYNTLWTSGGTDTKAYDLTTQNDSIRTVTSAGSGKKDLQTYSASGVGTVQVAHTLPSTIAYAITSTTDSKTNYYAYSNGSVLADGGVTAATFSKTYPLYLSSPDGTKNFWSDVINGRQTLMVGDKNAGSPTTLASSSDYNAYGWYGSQYLLLSRDGKGLYIVPVSGLGASGAPIKISYYYQSPTVAGGYGGGF